MKHRLINSGLSQLTVTWFDNDLSDRTQCVQAEGVTSGSLIINKGVPQGLALGALLFILYTSNINHNNFNAIHFRVDDTLFYCSSSTPNQALSQLQLVFNTDQHNLYNLKLGLNAEETKLMLFSNAKSRPENLPSIYFSRRLRYLGILNDDSLLLLIVCS